MASKKTNTNKKKNIRRKSIRKSTKKKTKKSTKKKNTKKSVKKSKNGLIKVGGVATHAKWPMSNWINAIVINNGIARPIGLNEKWGGWLWRTQKTIEFLNKQDPSDIVVITDVYDAYVVRKLDNLIKLFKTFNSRIVVSAEEYWSPKGLEKIRPEFTKEYYTDLLKNKFGNDFLDYRYQYSINAGQLMGYVSDLKKLMKKTEKFMKEKVNDDQAALYDVYLDWLTGKIKKKPFTLDFDSKIFGTLSNHHQYEHRFEWNELMKAWKYTPSGTYPLFLHFAGEQFFEVYRLMGKKIYGEIFNYNCSEKGK